jgi:hypothetical protein
MSEFEYIECPEGQEQGPAIEDTAPYCVPADEANPGAPVLEVGLLIYKKLDATLPASWPNSGEQTFIAAQPGTDWFTVFPGELPAHVCGDGWAIQQDAIGHDGSFVWPLTITYPDNVLSKAGVLNDAIHQELSELIVVPECVTVTPEPTPPPAPPRELAETGFDPLTAMLFAGSVFFVGVALLVARSVKKEA